MGGSLKKGLLAICLAVLVLCFQPPARAAEARIPLSAGEFAPEGFEVTSSVPCETVFSLEGGQFLRPLLPLSGGWPEGEDLISLLGTSKTARSMLDKLKEEGLARSAGMFVREKEEAYFVPLARDPFETGMDLVGAAMVLRRNGNAGGWYVSSVSAAYEGGETRGIVARYLADREMRLKCYSVFTLAGDFMYVSHYPPLGGYWEAWAVDARGLHYKSIPSYSISPWYCVEKKDFARTPLLLAPQSLAPQRGLQPGS